MRLARAYHSTLWGALLVLGACAPAVRRPAPAVGLPPVPRVEGALDIRVAHPSAGAVRPRADSTFVFGSVGTGRATLTINDVPVPVAPNGAFLGFVPVPANGTYELVAQAGGQTDRETLSYRPPAPPAAAPSAPAAPVRTVFPQPLSGTVVGVSDTLATGSDVAPGYPVPSTSGNRRWFFPRATRITALARQNGMIQAQLGPGATAWIQESLVSLGAPASAAAVPIGAVSLRPQPRFVDVRIPAGGAPFLIQEGEDARTVTVALYGAAAPPGAPNVSGDPLLRGGGWAADTSGAPRLELQLARPLWGYKAFYEPDGTLVVRLRRPPPIDRAQPLRGVRIMVDAGHPPGGAIGPTGLTEAEANLAVSLRLAHLLRQRGAEVLMTRTTAAPVVSATNTSAELSARVDMAVRADADLLVSVHNNAFAEGTNPFQNYGTSVLYFHPHSRALARALNDEIVQTTRIRDLGPIFQNIAIGRATWMPSVITESLFMMFPEQEAALRDPGFQERLAMAHVRGIEEFLRNHGM